MSTCLILNVCFAWKCDWLCSGASPELVMSGLQRGCVYTLRVRALNGIGAGTFSPAAAFSTLNCESSQALGSANRCSPFLFCTNMLFPTTFTHTHTHTRALTDPEFKYERDLDENGLLFYLGTDGGKRAWINPMQAGRATVTASSQSCGQPLMVVGREPATCYSNNVANSWFAIDLGAGTLVRPNYYTLRHSHGNSNALRNWRLEGSEDGTTWHTLRVHVNDAALPSDPSSPATASWPLATERFVRHLRVFQSGPNADGQHYLMLGGFEVYGEAVLP